MNISEIKDLLAQFDASTLREFSYKNNGEELNLSKNQTSSVMSLKVHWLGWLTCHQLRINQPSYL